MAVRLPLTLLTDVSAKCHVIPNLTELPDIHDDGSKPRTFCAKTVYVPLWSLLDERDHGGDACAHCMTDCHGCWSTLERRMESGGIPLSAVFTCGFVPQKP